MFSKIVVGLSSAFLAFTIFAVLTIPMELGVAVALIPSSFSIFLTTVVWYYKKAEAENVKKIMVSYYKDSMDIRYEYNKKTAELMKKMGLTENDMNKIQSDSPMDEVTDEAFTEGKDKLKERSDDAMTLPEAEKVDSVG